MCERVPWGVPHTKKLDLHWTDHHTPFESLTDLREPILGRCHILGHCLAIIIFEQSIIIFDPSVIISDQLIIIFNASIIIFDLPLSTSIHQLVASSLFSLALWLCGSIHWSDGGGPHWSIGAQFLDFWRLPDVQINIEILFSY